MGEDFKDGGLFSYIAFGVQAVADDVKVEWGDALKSGVEFCPLSRASFTMAASGGTLTAVEKTCLGRNVGLSI